MCYTLGKGLVTFCLCPEILQETQIKGSRLIELVLEMSRQPSSQAMTLVMLTAFSQIYSEN